MFNQPNIDIAADVNTVSPLFNANLVETGPVFRKGYWSQVTAGPKTGFGLLPSDDGIAFYNKQTLVSVTPITDFQNQIAADPQGPAGRQALPIQRHLVRLVRANHHDRPYAPRASRFRRPPPTTSTQPSARRRPRVAGSGAGSPRSSGMNQNAITQKVKEGALPRFQQQIPAEAQEEALERIAKQTAERNADLRSQGPCRQRHCGRE